MITKPVIKHIMVINLKNHKYFIAEKCISSIDLYCWLCKAPITNQ